MKEESVGKMARAGILGALVGGAVGFGLGILLAPEEGQKIRRRLVYQLERMANQVGDFVDDMLYPEERGDARQKGDALVADARSRAQQIQEDIESLMGEVKKHGTSRSTSNN